MILAKHLHSLYNFYSNKKFLSWVIFIIFLIVFLIDTFLIYGIFSIAFSLIANSKIDYSKSLMVFGLTRIILFIVASYLIRKSFLELLHKALRKFFLFLPTNKNLFGKSQILSNLLKFESDINFIIFDSNNFYFNIIMNVAEIIAFFTAIILININHFYLLNIVISLGSLLFLIPICILSYYEKIIEKKSQTKVEKYLASTNEVVLNYIEQNDLKEMGEGFNDYVSNVMKTLFSEIKKIIISNFSLHLIGLFVVSIYVIVLSLSVYYLFVPHNFVNIAIYIVFHLLLMRAIYRLVNNYINKSFFGALTQANIINIGNYQYSSMGNNSSTKPILSIESIEFKNTSIYLADDINDHYLENLNIFIKAQNIIAIISTDHSHISIFTKIISDNLKIKSGEILINDHNINSIDKENLENAIKIVDIYNLDYNEHIKKNLMGDNENISEELIAQACRISGLSDYISTLSLGYYSKLNDISLTNIEKFQISLTKILLADAQVIIFNFLDVDENHDAIKRIKKILLQTLPERMVIFIVDNADSLELFHKIYIIKDNKILTSGTHKDLLENINYSNFYLKNSHNVTFNE